MIEDLQRFSEQSVVEEVQYRSSTISEMVSGGIISPSVVEEEDKLSKLITKLSQQNLKNKRYKSDQINILSIDGGGIRMFIPLIILMELERCTGRSVASMFQVVGGTSFGGLIAAALSKKVENKKDKFKPDLSTLELFQFLRKNIGNFFKESKSQK